MEEGAGEILRLFFAVVAYLIMRPRGIGISVGRNYGAVPSLAIRRRRVRRGLGPIVLKSRAGIMEMMPKAEFYRRDANGYLSFEALPYTRLEVIGVAGLDCNINDVKRHICKFGNRMTLSNIRIYKIAIWLGFVK